MRKVLSVLLALSLALCLTGGALAEVTLERIGSALKGTRWVSGTPDLLSVGTRDNLGLMTMDGRALTPAEYSMFVGEYGHVQTMKIDGEHQRFGLVAQDGTTIIPCEYDALEPLNENWCVAIRLTESDETAYDYYKWDDFSAQKSRMPNDARESFYAQICENLTCYLIEQADVYSLKKGACVASLPRDAYDAAGVAGDVINIRNRTTGVITSYDADFNALGEASYGSDDTYASRDVLITYESGKYGLSDATGNVILAPTYYYITPFDSDIFAFKREAGGGYGLLDGQGNVVVEPVYDYIDEFCGDYAHVRDENGQYGLMDKQGRLVVPMQFEYFSELSTLDGKRYDAAGYLCVTLDGKTGYANLQGEITCEPIAYSSWSGNEGVSFVYWDEQGKKHILAADGTDTQLGENYQNALAGTLGFLYEVDGENGTNVVDWHGNVLLEGMYYAGTSGNGKYLIAGEFGAQEWDVYAVNYGVALDAAPVAAPAAAPVAAPTAEPTAVPTAEPTAVPTAAPTAVPTAVPVQAQPDTSDAKTLLGSAITLIEADAAANSLTVTMLLDGVLGMTQDASAQTLLVSVKALLEADAAANAAAAATLLRSALTLL